jgi:type IV pilus assembly protein PilY1
MNKQPNFLIRSGLAAFAATLVSISALSVPAPVRADDTEVFFPPATTSGGASGINPNILFIIDTSGSMGSDDGFTDANGNPLSRLRRVQIAFRQIVQEFGSNVNIGVARFSNEQGGPILFPVLPIDAVPGGTTLNQDITESGGCANEAEQNYSPSQPTRCSGAATSYSLRLGTDYDKIYEQGNNQDEAEEWSASYADDGDNKNSSRRTTDAATTATGSRCSTDLDLTYDRNQLAISCMGYEDSAVAPLAQTVGIRFPSVDIPKVGTTILYAALNVTDTGKTSSGTPTINVYGQKSDASASFVGGRTNSNVTTGRPLTTNSYVWTPVAGTPFVPFFSATAVASSNPPTYNNTATNSNLKDVVQEVIQAKTTTSTPYPVTLVMNGPNNAANDRAVYGIYNGVAGGTTVDQRPKLAVVYSGGTYNNLLTGVRFNNVQIPRGAVVTKATIEFHNAETVDSRDLTLEISADNAGNSVAFAPPATDDLRSRTLTASRVSWATSAGGSAGTSAEAWTVPYKSYTTPSITSLVNEVTSRGDWCGGNNMTFMFSKTSGDAGRNAVSANMNPNYSPILHLELDTAQAAYATGCVNGSNSQQITSSSDDAQEKPSDGSMATAGTVLSLGCNATSGCPSSTGTVNSKSDYDGVRFSGIKLPQGAVIQSAFIDFTANGADSGASTLILRGEKATNSAAFNNTSNNISNRRTSSSTSATVSWTPSNWANGTVYTTPDLTTVLQEMVNQTGWTAASAATFIVEGIGRRRAYSLDGSAGSAPKLRVTFQGANGSNTSALTVRRLLPDLVDSLSAVGYTPTVGTLYEAARYYRGEDAYYGRTRGGGYVNGDKSGEPPSNANLMNVSSDLAMVAGTTPHALPTGCTAANYKSAACAGESWTGTPVYQSPITDGCQGNNIVLLSDGFPNQGGISDGVATARTKVTGMIGKACLSYRNSGGATQSEWACGPDIANYLNTTDQIPSTATSSHPALTGSQTVRTYTIGFGADVASGGSDSNGAEFLNKVAQSGGGSYFSAQSADSLVQVFRTIVSNILNINTTFVAPAVTVNTFNQLTDRNELYFAVFKPGTNIDWRGNLKRYQIAQKTNDTSPQIYDSTAAPNGPLLAVDAATGFFKDGTKSFWSPAVDGSDVASGGAASVLAIPRNVYTYTGGTPTNVTLSGVASYRVQSSNTTLNPADSASSSVKIAANQLLGLPDTAVNADRTPVLDWTAGIDVQDDNGNGSTTDARTQLGDPLHSEPILINYGVAATSPAPPAEQIPDIAIYMGTNDGGIHAFNAVDGTEYFNFIPQELLPHLNSYYTDVGNYQNRPYGMDGPITSWVNDANGNGKLYTSGSLESGEFAYVYAGMRRGGKNYYALDVTNRNAPVLKFQIKGGGANTSYVELGQTWSRAEHARIRVDTTTGGAKDVLIFTGGYDTNVDAQSGGAIQPDTQGRALYVADAATGALLWWAGFNDTTSGNTIHPNLAVPQMIYSVPASPKLMDLDGDGYVDRIYIADAGGQIFRFILGKDSTTGLRNLGNASVQYMAQLSGTTVASAHRFYATPSAAVVSSNTATPFIALAIGSGFREHPLDVTNEDRYYVIRDPDLTNETNANRTVKDIVDSATTAYVRYSQDGATPPDLYDATANNIGVVCAAGDTTCAANKTAAKTALGTSTTNGTSKGFYIKLLTSGALKGEKVLSASIISAGVIYFATFEPGSSSTSSCTAVKGLSRLYTMNVVDGTPTQDNTTTATGADNGTSTLTAADRALKLNIGGLPPNPIIISPSISTYTSYIDANGTEVLCIGDICKDRTDTQEHVCTGSNCISGYELVCIGAICKVIRTKKFNKYSWRKTEN